MVVVVVVVGSVASICVPHCWIELNQKKHHYGGGWIYSNYTHDHVGLQSY